MIELSKRTKEKIDILFPFNKRAEVQELLLAECSANLLPPKYWKITEMERIWFSVLKLSEGDIGKLIQAINLARIDFRDLFVAAGFDEDVEAHNKWQI